MKQLEHLRGSRPPRTGVSVGESRTPRSRSRPASSAGCRLHRTAPWHCAHKFRQRCIRWQRLCLDAWERAWDVQAAVRRQAARHRVGQQWCDPSACGCCESASAIDRTCAQRLDTGDPVIAREFVRSKRGNHRAAHALSLRLLAPCEHCRPGPGDRASQGAICHSCEAHGLGSPE